MGRVGLSERDKVRGRAVTFSDCGQPESESAGLFDVPCQWLCDATKGFGTSAILSGLQWAHLGYSTCIA